VLSERYANVERIGSGGMGDIMRAEDTSLGRTVAVKLLAERYAADESVRARFTREALAAARVSASPHTVTIFDVGEWEGRPYIVMEYMPGGSLADRLAAGGAQPPGKVLGWLEGAAEALDAAHRHGVGHRDVKPGNLLLDEDETVKVADFGIASAAGTDSLTQDGMVLGTAGYLSPEQARGEPTTPASDRYALGVVAYELLSGRRPFERDSPTAEAAAHANDPHPAISKQRGDLPRSLDAVFGRALAKDPRERHGSCRELVADLRAALRADAGPTWVMAPPPPPPPVSEPRPAVGRRRSVLPLAAGLVALLGLGGVALAAALSGDDPPPAETQVRESTIERTVTSEGETVTVTTTTPAEPPPEEEESPPTTTSAEPSGDPAELNDQGFRLMQAGDYQAALPLLEQAVAGSENNGSLTEAYASYNLAFTRFQLGSCDGVLDLLDRSEQVQGQRAEIDELRRQAQQACSGDGEGDDD
jgi:eukaryotic-like serine/threonine-protein kinase